MLRFVVIIMRNEVANYPTCVWGKSKICYPPLATTGYLKWGYKIPDFTDFRCYPLAIGWFFEKFFRFVIVEYFNCGSLFNDNHASFAGPTLPGCCKL